MKLSLVASAALTLVACAPPADEPVGEVTATMQSQLTIGSTVTAINGTYTNCVDRSGSWSVTLNGGTDPLPALSIVKDDTTCELRITHVFTGATDYTAGTPLLLTTSYGGASTTFTSGGLSFRANAKVSSHSFNSNFDITLVHEADPVSAATEVASSYATVQMSTVTVLITPSDYTTTFNNLTVQLNAAKVVQSVSGTISLVDGSRTGALWVVDQGTLGASPDNGAVAAAFLGAGASHVITTSPVIAASDLGLVGQNLTNPVVRTIIVARTIAAITGYQLFKITFKAP